MTIDTARHDVWGASPGGGRTRRHEARAKELRDRLVALADRDIPGIASSIVFETTATPISEERYMRCTGGTSYGIAATPRQVMLGRPGPKTPIRGLFLAGASTRTGHGLVGTLAGGVAAAAAVTGTPMAELLAPTSGSAAAALAAWNGHPGCRSRVGHMLMVGEYRGLGRSEAVRRFERSAPRWSASWMAGAGDRDNCRPRARCRDGLARVQLGGVGERL